MTTITYTGRAPSVTWNGVEFDKGEAVTLNPDIPAHKHMLTKAVNNPHFMMGSVEATPDTGNDEADLRAQLKAHNVTIPGRAGIKWMSDKLEEIQNG